MSAGCASDLYAFCRLHEGIAQELHGLSVEGPMDVKSHVDIRVYSRVGVSARRFGEQAWKFEGLMEIGFGLRKDYNHSHKH